MLTIDWAADHPSMLVGVVEADGVRVAPSDAALAAAIDAAVARATLPEAVRAAVRDVLRRHGYKPTGRGKPASEYLFQAAGEGRFPRINNLVDINNLLSLETGWPCSVLDRDRTGDELVVRPGAAGESYVFNQAGQAIDVAGLTCLARRGGAPLANPVKDSMAAKVGDDTRRVVALLYAPRAVADEAAVLRAARRFGDLLSTHAGAGAVSARVLP